MYLCQTSRDVGVFTPLWKNDFHCLGLKIIKLRSDECSTIFFFLFLFLFFYYYYFFYDGTTLQRGRNIGLTEIQPTTLLHRGEGLRSKVMCQNVSRLGDIGALTGTHFGQQSLDIGNDKTKILKRGSIRINQRHSQTGINLG